MHYLAHYAGHDFRKRPCKILEEHLKHNQGEGEKTRYFDCVPLTSQEAKLPLNQLEKLYLEGKLSCK